jgi:hypothetical protein
MKNFPLIKSIKLAFVTVTSVFDERSEKLPPTAEVLMGHQRKTLPFLYV